MDAHEGLKREIDDLRASTTSTFHTLYTTTVGISDLASKRHNPSETGAQLFLGDVDG